MSPDGSRSWQFREIDQAMAYPKAFLRITPRRRLLQGRGSLSIRGPEQHGNLYQPFEQPAAEPNVGLWIADDTARRLIEAIAFQLNLVPALLVEADLSAGRLFKFEMIIADAQVARRVRFIFNENQPGRQVTKPALVAVAPAYSLHGSQEEEHKEFDAILSMPEKPAMLAAQLSVALYSHRGLARPYQSALDESNLNTNTFKSVTSGISVSNALLPDLPLIYVNRAFEMMTGYSLEELRGKSCRFLQHEDPDQAALTLVREAITQKRATIAVFRDYRKDGSAYWNKLLLSPISNQEGVVTHIVGIQTDVTEQVEFETALRESEKLAAVGRMASAIAHEINNPLEAVMNLVYLSQHALPRAKGTADSRRYLAQADVELQRIKLITAQSLRFYKQSNVGEEVACDELLTSILDLYAPRLANFGIIVSRRERFTEPFVCVASEIRQVLSNLVSNAMDAMGHGGGCLFIRTREVNRGENPGRGVVITVADTGHGISKKTQASMYKAFYTTKGAAGTGLGLWISSDIVRRHHGFLRVRSRTGPRYSGTVFQLFLPFQAGEEGEYADRKLLRQNPSEI